MTRWKIKLGLLVTLISGISFIRAYEDLYTYLTTRKPIVLSYEEYVRTKPSAKALELKNCNLDLLGATYTQSRYSGLVDFAFIPIHTGHDIHSDKIFAVFATAEKSICETLDELKGVSGEVNILEWAAAHHDRVFPLMEALLGHVIHSQTASSVGFLHLGHCWPGSSSVMGPWLPNGPFAPHEHSTTGTSIPGPKTISFGVTGPASS